MIGNALISMLSSVIGFVRDLIPDWAWAHREMPTNGILIPNGTSGTFLAQGSDIEQWCQWFAYFNDILPVSDVVYVLELSIAWVGVLVAIRTGKWIIGVVRGSGTT